MARIKRLLFWVWKILTTPAATLSLAFLTLGGFVGGVIFWGAFNTALELTNTEEFCVSCHEMRANVYEELTRTVHFSNRSGVRASCPDCHVPHEWTDKIARKMQASKEVWGKIFGTINTREKFLDHRLELAKHEWARLKANDSLECRNCHSSAAMDLSKQTQRAAEIHTRYLLPGRATCIDCHKGIAHELPNMQGVEPGWKLPPELEGETLPSASAIDELKRVMDEAHSAALAN
ncbi:periplasmic nitrate (or nitrite) reductase c-type cytochrome NapC/NirT family protein [Sinorhizobium meliloti CCNWSX0020]|uniref:Cytochrome c-type protein n=2 Tax=Rhizobium meliloti TaxID=382 RepID=H0FVC1_RHIML|nr:cytochrome c3 family protein [Sinorhizobium meliloti]EHK78969.1 periplasmic nitrate (or nitrite) reductase c-type cytochrome NapC/NirT family protein [Sinorhizobium meliloti CCNWSX0020]RVE89577.1 cytochrome C [Sinorhizobium meliloti]RVG67484.1 cytochrome C [Sinorhizobium meliloti]RVH31305.1 cytochrome C [Sinorhizobium meliloti]RVH34705.1 cytochrome C [Sinorhizobium meliloti]